VYQTNKEIGAEEKVLSLRISPADNQQNGISLTKMRISPNRLEPTWGFHQLGAHLARQHGQAHEVGRNAKGTKHQT
jgi:hypothetical protein